MAILFRMAKSSPSTKPTRLLETVLSESLSKDSVDRDAGVIRGVKVLGRISANGREYSDKAMDDAQRVYEGLTVKFDHNREGKERKFVESFGNLQNLTKKPDGIYGDLHYKKSHPHAELVCESAERFSKDFGLSHDAEGSMVKRGGKMIVESIVKARSVDIVNDPATNAGLFESIEEPSMTKISTTIKKLVESAKDKAKRYTQANLTKLLEMEGGDSAMMSAPVDVMGPPEDSEPDPDQLIDDAFAAMVSATMSDSTLDLKGKIDRITEILTAQDSLMNGTTAKKAPPTPAGDTKVAESTELKEIKDGLAALIESNKALAKKQAESDAKALLLESKREVTTDRIKEVLEAQEKGDKYVKLLFESWPEVQDKPRMQKPFSQSIMESKELGDYPADTDSFLRSIGAKVKV